MNGQFFGSIRTYMYSILHFYPPRFCGAWVSVMSRLLRLAAVVSLVSVLAVSNSTAHEVSIAVDALPPSQPRQEQPPTPAAAATARTATIDAVPKITQKLDAGDPTPPSQHHHYLHLPLCSMPLSYAPCFFPLSPQSSLVKPTASARASALPAAATGPMCGRSRGVETCPL